MITILWVVLAATIITIPIWWGGTRFRLKVHSWRYFGRSAAWREFGCLLDEWFFVMSLLQVVAMVVVVLVFTACLFGPEHLPGGSIVALATVAFFFTQAPRLTPPTFEAAFVGPFNDACNGGCLKRHVSAAPNGRCLLRFRVTNLSITGLENCTVRFAFKKGFEVLSDDGLYEGVASKKILAIQSEKWRAVFEPGPNHMGVAPGDFIEFPVWVRTPPDEGQYDVRVLFSSLSRAGQARRNLRIDVRKDAV